MWNVVAIRYIEIIYKGTHPVLVMSCVLHVLFDPEVYCVYSFRSVTRR